MAGRSMRRLEARGPGSSVQIASIVAPVSAFRSRSRSSANRNNVWAEIAPSCPDGYQRFPNCPWLVNQLSSTMPLVPKGGESRA
jgi:hypothetical protein